MTKTELEQKLNKQLAEGKISAEEAELEWQDFTHRDEVWTEW